MSGFSFIIPPSVLLSAPARKRFQFAAWMTKLFLVLIVVLSFWTSDKGELPARELLKLVLFVGAISMAALIVGMEVYWRKFDRSTSGRRTLWFIVMALLLPVGALAYFYAVYLPQTKPQETAQQAFTATVD